MTARDVAQDVLIAVEQQSRLIAAARRLEPKARQAVRDLLVRTQKQTALSYWESACELADGEA